MPKLYSIRNIEQLTGIRAATIRMWEKRYNLIEPKRTETNIRFYDFADVKKLLLIATLTKEGYKISELASLTIEELYERAIIIYNDQKILFGDLTALYYEIVNFNVRNFELIINQLIVKYGFVFIFNYLILPLIYKIDAAADDKTIENTHRNFAFFLIEKLLISAINRYTSTSNLKKYVLFTDNWLINKIILLFGAYKLLSMGKEVLILGQMKEISDFFTTIENFADYNIMTTTFLFKKDNDYFLERISDFPMFNFFLLDPNIVIEDKGYPNLFLLHNLMEIDKDIL